MGKRKYRTPKEYREELFDINPQIVAVEDFISLKNKILHRCKVCGYEWYIKPENLIHNKQGCPRCNKRHYKRTRQEFQDDINEIHDNIVLLEDVDRVADKVRFRCTKCGNEWIAKMNNILSGRGCPVCKASSGERKIARLLNKLNLEYVREYHFQDEEVALLSFDFYLPKLNMCIEFDGKQHFEPIRFGGMSMEDAKKNLISQKERDKKKNEYCQEQGVALLRISYEQVNIIEDLITSFIK